MQHISVLQEVSNPCDTIMESKGMRMKIIVLVHLQKSGMGSTEILKMCLLLPRCTAFPEVLPPHASSDAKRNN